MVFKFGLGALRRIAHHVQIQNWWWPISLRWPFQVSIDPIGGTTLRLGFTALMGVAPKWKVVGSISYITKPKIILNRAFNYSMSKEAMMIQRITHITKDETCLVSSSLRQGTSSLFFIYLGYVWFRKVPRKEKKI